MFILWILFLFGCQSNLIGPKVKGTLDELVRESQNYMGDVILQLDQPKVMKLMKDFLECPEALQYPLEPSPCDNISFIHLLFAIRSSGNDMNGNVFKSVYDKLFSVNKDLTEESIFDLETDLGCNVIHLSLKYMNRAGFEKINEINKRRDLREYFTSPDILGNNPLTLASHVLALAIFNYYGDSCYTSESLCFLREAITYMISNKYFLNSSGYISTNEGNRNFLTEAINVFSSKYENDDGNGAEHVKKFLSTFKILFANLLISLDDIDVALELLKEWQTNMEVPSILKEGLSRFVETELDSFIDKVEYVSEINEYDALRKNERDLLPIEEAIKAGDLVC